MNMKRKNGGAEEEAMVKLLVRKKKLQTMLELKLITKDQFEQKIEEMMDAFEENSFAKLAEEHNAKKVRVEKSNTIEALFDEVC